MILTEAIVHYIDSIVGQVGKQTVEGYKRRLKYFRLFCSENQIEDTLEIDVTIVKKYMRSVEKQGLSRNTEYVYVEAVKKFLNFLYEKEIFFIDLRGEIALPKWERKKKVALTEKQIETLIKKAEGPVALRSRNRLLIGMYYLEKIKVSELQRMSVLDIDFTCPGNSTKVKTKFSADEKKDKQISERLFKKTRLIKSKA